MTQSSSQASEFSRLHHPWLTLAGPGAGDLLTLTPATAGWAYCGLRVVRFEPGELRRFSTGPEEMFVLPLVGGLTARGGRHGDALPDRGAVRAHRARRACSTG